MIFSALIFFSYSFHDKILDFFYKILKQFFRKDHYIKKNESLEISNKKIIYSSILIFFVIQILVPFRYLLYPGELLWHEQGYRYSWRVMLVEKTGIATFRVYDPNNDTSFYVDNSKYLTPFQEKQMSFQPDFILEYAHFLGNKFSSSGDKNIEVYVENFVSLNGRRSQRLVSNEVDLLTLKNTLKNKHWILPLKDEIKGI